MKKITIILVTVALFVGVGITIPGSASAQDTRFQRPPKGGRAGGSQVRRGARFGGPKRPNPLAKFKRALSAAGGPDLTDQQGEQLISVIMDFREVRQPERPNTILQSARRAYEDAILAGDLETAQEQADVMADQIASATNAHLQNQAELRISILAVLSGDQVDSLLQLIGTRGLSNLLRSMTRGGGPFRPSDEVGWNKDARIPQQYDKDVADYPRQYDKDILNYKRSKVKKR